MNTSTTQGIITSCHLASVLLSHPISPFILLYDLPVSGSLMFLQATVRSHSDREVASWFPELVLVSFITPDAIPLHSRSISCLVFVLHFFLTIT